ncbi:unnamed protein product [Durusdinium trenchii]|uniref:Uncharacterized protein n=1 Tax=Durusdinium trenchii TaxID=1381693 RepID=A0ABP0M796_9DINO
MWGHLSRQPMRPLSRATRAGAALLAVMVASLAGLTGHCFVATGSLGRPRAVEHMARQAVKRVRKRSSASVSKPKVKVKKLGKSKQGSSEDSVWDYIQEKDKAALAEGAFMDTFFGQAVQTVTYIGIFGIIIWEIYLNTIYPRASPTYNPINPSAMYDDSGQVAYD